jgi:hypothetical protein
MKNLAITMLILWAASAAVLADGIDGKWISEMQVGDADGKTYTHTSTFTLKNGGGALTGTVVQVSEAPWMKEMTGKTVEISDGKVDGDKFTFKMKLDTNQGERTAVYEGTIEGNQLKGITKYRGIGITRPFAAKRAN